MEFETWRTWGGPGLLEPQAWEYPLQLLCTALALLVVALQRRSVQGWKRRLVLAGCLISTVPLTLLLVLTPGAGADGARPDLYTGGPPPSVALLGALPVVVAAWLGAGPALLVGWASGLVQAALTTGGLTDAFHLALFGLVLGLLLHQEYRGRLAMLLRQPLAACLLAALAAAPMLCLSVFVRLADRPLAGLADALAWTTASLPALLVESLVAGLAAQAAFALLPSVRLVHDPSKTAPYSRSIHRRALLSVAPLLLILTAGPLCAVTAEVVRVEKSQAIDRMAVDAEAAALGFAYFVHAGEGLLAQFAAEEGLQAESQSTLEEQLRSDQSAVAFFDRLALFTDGGVPIADYPPCVTPAQLTEEEHQSLQLVVDAGAPQTTSAHSSGEDGVVFSFLAPVGSGDSASPYRVLLGRVRAEVNPLLRGILEGLQDPDGLRQAFVVDGENRIVVHADAALLLADWPRDRTAVPIAADGRGTVFDGRGVDGTARELTYYLPVEGSPWTIVLLLPFEAILAQAGRVALPLLLLQVLVSAAVAVAAPLAAQRLAASAGSEVEPDSRPAVEDEYEHSQQKAGGAPMTSEDLHEALTVIAEVGQRIATVAEPRDAVPMVLEAALKASGSAVARLVFPSREGTPQTVVGRGDAVDGVALVDSALGAAATEPDKPIVIEDLSKETTFIDRRASRGEIKALVAVPIRTANVPSVIMWTGYTEPQEFSDASISLIRSLSGLIGALLDSSHQLGEARAERFRLAAVLDDSGEGIVITDQEGKIIHMNPAAAQALGVDGTEAAGKELSQIGLPSPLLQLIQDAGAKGELQSHDVSLPDGRTWRFAGSTVVGPEGQPAGQAIRMQDVSDFRQADESRAEFIGKLTHDLRTPLSLVRGYGAMFPTEGELNERQGLFLDKMMMGARQMEQMLDELTELEFADSDQPLDLRPCHLGTILTQSVDSRRAHAAAKGLSLRLDVPERGTTVSGDADLLRQAVNLLVDNAVKHTPAGGIVTVGLETQGDEAQIRIADTGKGFPPGELARVLEAFRGTPSSEASGKEQIGMGLSAVLSIVRRHGGTVSIDSEPGTGSTISFKLPVARKGEKPGR